jgi:hypothetical protein
MLTLGGHAPRHAERAARRAGGTPSGRVSYGACWRRTISLIQIGAYGDVQPGEVG